MNAQLTNPNLFAEVSEFGIRESESTNVDYVVITHAKFKQPDGKVQKELAIGVTEGDLKHGYVSVLDVLKFALLHGGEELIKKALLETGMTGDIRRLADEVDQDYDMRVES
jgi:hypothetical protein